MTMIIADDDPFLRRMLQKFFIRKGWEVVVLGSGVELALWPSQADWVISDVEMPGGLDGIKACECLRRRWPRAKFVIMTGSANRRSQARRAGFQGVLAKPFLIDELEALLAPVPAAGDPSGENQHDRGKEREDG